ncbi:MAG: inorganic phosphate transporter [Nitrososphaerales archaeon]
MKILFLDPLTLSIVAVAFLFDFVNGFDDAANSIATVVSTRVLSPIKAVSMAAFFNFVALFVFQTGVASTIGQGIVDPLAVTPVVVLAALSGAIVWVLITWWFGLPISASHSLIGGLIGASVANSGFGVIVFGKIELVLAFIVISPLAGTAAAFLLMVLVIRIFRRRSGTYANRYFRRLQLVSASLYSLSHGGNDAQKTMGIVAVLLFSAGYLGSEFYVPFWVAMMAHLAIALGTLTGGWRIVHTMGVKITKLDPMHGFGAETAGAAVIIAATMIGIPVSTTHVIAGSIIGVGATRRLSAVRWGVARRIMWAWVITIPVAAGLAIPIYWIASLFL